MCHVYQCPETWAICNTCDRTTLNVEYVLWEWNCSTAETTCIMPSHTGFWSVEHVKGRSPVHLPTESMGVYEMSRVPVPIMGGAPIIDHQLVVKGTWLLHPRWRPFLALGAGICVWPRLLLSHFWNYSGFFTETNILLLTMYRSPSRQYFCPREQPFQSL